MSVSKFDPSKDSAGSAKQAAVANLPNGSATQAANSDISVTSAAQVHISEQLKNSGAAQVRLGVKESGCNGFMYTLDFVDAPDTQDLKIAVAPNLELVVSKDDIALVGGTEIDLVTEGLNTALRFKNPNAESHCGCGESFSIATAEG